MRNYSKIKEPVESGIMEGMPLTVSMDEAIDNYFIRKDKKKVSHKKIVRKKSAKKV